MAVVTNLACNGTSVLNGGMSVGLSWKAPSGAWDYRVMVTGSDISAQAFTVSPWNVQSSGNYDIYYDLQGGVTVFVIGANFNTTYTASVTCSTVAPPGVVSWGSAVTTTYSQASSTPGLYLRSREVEEPYDSIILAVDAGTVSTYPAVGGITLTGAGGYSQTQLFSIPSAGARAFKTFDGLVPGTLYTATATIDGYGATTRTYYCPTPQNTFGKAVVSPTAITLPWTDPPGSSVSASNIFTTAMLWNNTTKLWIATQVVAIGVQTVTFSSLTTGNEYYLYCFPVNSTGLGSAQPSYHYITFEAGGTATFAQFGINWFYSPKQQ